jgi:hypothetical protein
MAKNKNEDLLSEVLWVKAILYSLTILIVIVVAIVVPKKVFDDGRAYQLATSMAAITDDGILLYDYKVYGNETRFNDGLIYDVEEAILAFKERNEVLAVKIYGENNSVEINDDYIFIISPETPELNIEYYLVKDIEINDIKIPCRTFIMLFEDISKIVNIVYLSLFLIISICIFTSVSIKLTRSISFLRSLYSSSGKNHNKAQN